MRGDSNADGMVEVVIATAGRPDFLAVALQSVVDQKLPDRIRRVVVSENGADRRSESVARAFAGKLPIDYRFKSPCLPPLDHLSSLFESAASDYVAFLCDDDWWLDGFLLRSLAELDHRHDCVAAFSASFWCRSEHDEDGEKYLPLALQAVLETTECPVAMRSDQVHAAAWIVTPFHFSTMVARRAPLRQAASKLRSFDAFNIDRLLEILLSVEGNILFFQECGAGIRQHGSNWSVVEKRERALRSDSQAVRFALASAPSVGGNVVEFWKDKIGMLSLREKREILRSLVRVYDWEELRGMGLIRSAAGTGGTGFLREIGLRYGGRISRALPESLRKRIKRSL